MSSGYRNNLAKQMAEHLVCVELGRRGFAATPFSGNVPTYDVLAANPVGHALPIQVKATRGTHWTTNVLLWMDVEFDPQKGVQKYLGPKPLPTPDLVYVCVALAALGSTDYDRFYILTMKDLQDICIRGYKSWMDLHDWKRPRKPDSYHQIYDAHSLREFENNWQLIEEQLQELPITPSKPI